MSPFFSIYGYAGKRGKGHLLLHYGDIINVSCLNSCTPRLYDELRMSLLEIMKIEICITEKNRALESHFKCLFAKFSLSILHYVVSTIYLTLSLVLMPSLVAFDLIS